MLQYLMNSTNICHIAHSNAHVYILSKKNYLLRFLNCTICRSIALLILCFLLFSAKTWLWPKTSILKADSGNGSLSLGGHNAPSSLVSRSQEIRANKFGFNNDASWYEEDEVEDEEEDKEEEEDEEDRLGWFLVFFQPDSLFKMWLRTDKPHIEMRGRI